MRYSMDSLREARESRNYVLTGKIAVYMMTFGLNESNHLRACEAYAWSREQMGEWDEALTLYKLLEARHVGKLAAFMVTRSAGVLVRMGRHAEADRLLSSMERDLDDNVPNADDRAWVLRNARAVRNKLIL